MTPKQRWATLVAFLAAGAGLWWFERPAARTQRLKRRYADSDVNRTTMELPTTETMSDLVWGKED